MRYFGIVLVCVALLGYGAFLVSRERALADQRNRAMSQVNVLAECLSRKVGDDGYFVREDVQEVDPWGIRGGNEFFPTDRGCGEDGCVRNLRVTPKRTKSGADLLLYLLASPTPTTMVESLGLR